MVIIDSKFSLISKTSRFFVQQAAPFFAVLYRISPFFIVLFFATPPSRLRDGTDIRVLYES